MKRAIYPGTFDPLTRGHEDIVRRAAKLFDEVVVGVAESRSKQPLFSVAERIDMARERTALTPTPLSCSRAHPAGAAPPTALTWRKPATSTRATSWWP